MRNRFVLLLLLFSLGGLSAETVKISLTPNPVGINDNISLILEVEAEKFSDIDISSVTFPDGVQVRRGPYMRSFTDSNSLGEKVPHVRISYTLRSRRTGRIALGPFKFTVADRTVITDEILLEVGTYRGGQLKFPLEVAWKVPDDFVYQGQAVPLTLMVYRQRDIGLVDSVSVTSPRSGFFEDAPGLGVIETGEIGGTILYDVPVSSYLYTPSTPGRVTLRGGTVQFAILDDSNNLSGTAENFLLDVMALPPEVADTGAVGVFHISGEGIDQARQGEEFHYALTVEGEGNLNYLQIPDIEVLGGTILSVEENEDYEPSLGGYSGFRQKVYAIQVDDVETLEIINPAFNYIETKADAIRMNPEFTSTFAVEFSDDAVNDDSGNMNLPAVTDIGLPIDGGIDIFHQPLLYLLLLPGILFFLIAIIVKKVRGKKGLALFLIFLSFNIGADSFEQTLSTVQDLLDAGEYDQVELLLGDEPPSDWIETWHFSKGVSAANQEQWDKAIWHLRSALEIRPMENVFRDSLKIIESTAGIHDSYTPTISLDLNFFFILFAIGLNLSFIMGGLLLFKPRGIYVILMILFIAATAISGVSAGIAAAYGQIDYGVASMNEEQVEPYLKRIPRVEAEDWFYLNPGTTLRILEQIDEYYLVKNGADVVGWIHEDLLLIVDE